MRLPGEPPHWISLVFAAWPLLLGFLSVWQRRSRGAPVLFFGVEGATFQERGVSGQVLRRAWWLRGGANNVLVVALADGRLVIRPFFPFNLFFLPEWLGLEIDVPASKVEVIGSERHWFQNWLLLRLPEPDGTTVDVRLRMKDPEMLVRVLDSQRRPKR